MSDQKKLAGTVDRSKGDAALEALFDLCREEDGSVDKSPDSLWAHGLSKMVKDANAARNWVREGLALGERFLERKKPKRPPGQEALFGTDFIYNLGKVRDGEGVEKYRSVRGSDMSVEQIILVRGVIAKNLEDVTNEAEKDFELIDAIVAGSRDHSEKAAVVAERLNLLFVPIPMPPKKVASSPQDKADATMLAAD